MLVNFLWYWRPEIMEYYATILDYTHKLSIKFVDRWSCATGSSLPGSRRAGRTRRPTTTRTATTPESRQTASGRKERRGWRLEGRESSRSQWYKTFYVRNFTNVRDKLECSSPASFSSTSLVRKFVNKDKRFYDIGPRSQCHKTFYVRNLLMFTISYSFCPWQAFTARSNICR